MARLVPRLASWQRWLTACLATVLALCAVPAAAAPAAQEVPGAQYTVSDCSELDADALRAELERHALAVLNTDGPLLDVDALVLRKWQELGMDATIDEAVRQAAEELAASEDYWNRLVSGWWGEKAQEYAERVANSAFSSPAFRAKLTELSTAIGAEVARQVESQFAQAASVGLLCLQAYVGEHFSATLFSAFQEQVRLETTQLELPAAAAPTIDVASQHNLALAGVGTILVTQVVYRLGQKLGEKIAQRVASKVVGRVIGRAGSSLIPVAGWVLGIGMIVYDLWEGGQGALPQIQEALQSQEVKAKIREEIAQAIKDDLPDQSALIALETAVSLVEEWQGFCARYTYVCIVAEENADFRSLLNLVTLDELPRLDAVVTLFMTQAGRGPLDQALANGDVERLLALPEETWQVLASTTSPTTILAWLMLAGTQLPAAAAAGVPLQAQPSEFTAASLQALLAVGAPEDVQTLLQLPPEKRAVLLALPPVTLQQLVQVRPPLDLDWLAGYMLLPGQQPAQLAAEVAKGAVTVPQLRGDPTASPAEDTTAALPSSVATPLLPADQNTGGLQSAPENDTIPGLIVLAGVVAAAGLSLLWLWRRSRLRW